MHIAIAGSGSTGLSCAHTLIDSGVPADRITLLDARAEVGSPAHKPGLLNHGDVWQPLLHSWGLTDQTYLHPTSSGLIGLRREWLEKSLAIGAAERGVHLFVKTRIIFSEFIGSRCRLICSDVGGLEGGVWEGDLVVDALGRPPAALAKETDHTVLSSSSENNLISIGESNDHIESPWLGIISSDQLATTPGVRSFRRGDGTWETWHQGSRNALDRESSLEEFSGTFSSFESACVDASLVRGVALAQAALERM